MGLNTSVGGACQFIIGGQLITIGDKVEVTPGGWVSEPVSGIGGQVNSIDKFVMPQVEVECQADPSVSISALQATKNVTVQVNEKNNRTWLLANAKQSGDCKFDVKTGKFSLTLFGTSCIERNA